MRLRRTGSSLCLTIPAEMVRAWSLREGDEVLILPGWRKILVVFPPEGSPPPELR